MKGTIWRVRTRGGFSKQWGAQRGDFIVDTAVGDPDVDPEQRYVLVRPIGSAGAITTGQILMEISGGHLEPVEDLGPVESPLRLVLDAD